MKTTPITTALAVLALAGLLGACGGSDGGSSSDEVASVSEGASDEQAQADEADAEQELLDWAECMRDEGVDIPDPTRDADGNLVISGNGIHIGGGSGGPSTDDAGVEGGEDGGEPPFSPEEMEAAEEACGPPPRLGAGDISEEDRQAMEDAALEFARCMRDEGVSDFPDPDFSDMGPGGAPERHTSDGDDGQSGQPRVVLGPFGEIDLDDPEVAAAFEACQDLLGLGGGPAGDAPQDEGSGA